MGSFERIDFCGDQFAVSMVKWGPIRRLIVSFMHGISKPKRFESPSFIPAFELAVFPGSSLRKPVVLIHFVDKVAARHGWDAVTGAIKTDGLEGATDYVCKITLSEMREFGQMFPDAL
jgi:hypothetical protein